MIWLVNGGGAGHGQHGVGLPWRELPQWPLCLPPVPIPLSLVLNEVVFGTLLESPRGTGTLRPETAPVYDFVML